MKAKNTMATALCRRMTEIDMTAQALANTLGLHSRDSVTSWRCGRGWPRLPTEQSLERALDLPVGFFAAMRAGMSYEQACASLATPLAAEETPEVIHKVRALLAADPATPVGALRMSDVQAYLTMAVRLIVDLTQPLPPKRRRPLTDTPPSV